LESVFFEQQTLGGEPAIIHRRRRTRYQATGIPDVLGRDRTSQELARLYRLVWEVGAARDSKQLSQVVLDGLFSSTSADTGAILLLPAERTKTPDPRQLHVVTYRATGELPYQKVSTHLSGIVLAEREAILARDIDDDSRLA